ncbi:polymorphic toxin-type HINT domain-containing protein [Streptomyces albulus]|nr:polymorphic toxin-type HINT domain-containing protein [Streptomyces noursei]
MSEQLGGGYPHDRTAPAGHPGWGPAGAGAPPPPPVRSGWRRPWLLGVAVCGLVLAVVAGTLLWWSARPEAAKDTDAERAPFYLAVYNLAQQPAAHYTGSAPDGATWDLTVTAGSEARGTISAAGRRTEVLTVDGKTYAKPPKDLLTDLPDGLSSDALDGKWVTGADRLTSTLSDVPRSPAALAARLWAGLDRTAGFPITKSGEGGAATLTVTTPDGALRLGHRAVPGGEADVGQADGPVVVLGFILVRFVVFFVVGGPGAHEPGLRRGAPARGRPHRFGQPTGPGQRRLHANVPRGRRQGVRRPDRADQDPRQCRGPRDQVQLQPDRQPALFGVLHGQRERRHHHDRRSRCQADRHGQRLHDGTGDCQRAVRRGLYAGRDPAHQRRRHDELRGRRDRPHRPADQGGEAAGGGRPGAGHPPAGPHPVHAQLPGTGPDLGHGLRQGRDRPEGQGATGRAGQGGREREGGRRPQPRLLQGQLRGGHPRPDGGRAHGAHPAPPGGRPDRQRRPRSGAVQQHTVSAVVVTDDDRDFVELTIAGPRGTGTVRSTAHHLFYDVTTARWTKAAALKPGDRVQTTGTAVATVREVRAYRAAVRTYNLSVDGVHTYYVLAGDTPVLVHNCAMKRDAKSLKGVKVPRQYQGLDTAHVRKNHFPGGSGVTPRKDMWPAQMTDARLAQIAQQAMRNNPKVIGYDPETQMIQAVAVVEGKMVQFQIPRGGGEMRSIYPLEPWSS